MAVKTYMGGSFNPPTRGHFGTGQVVNNAARPDEMVMLYSRNPDKDPAVYPPFDKRLEMGRIMAGFYPDTPFVMSDAEERLGLHQTFDVLSALQREQPDDTLIWVMGDDCLGDEKYPLGVLGWDHGPALCETFPIILMRRVHTADSLMKTPFGATYPHLQRKSIEELKEKKSGWILLDNPLIGGSSHELLAEIRQGVHFDDPAYEAIGDYIRQHGLYGITPPVPAQLPAPSPKLPRLG